MAKTKASTRKPKSVLEQDRYQAELSAGQLVIGVCILLMFGLGCFLLGVLIGKVDPSLQPDAVAQREAAQSQALGQPEPARQSVPPTTQPSEPEPQTTAPPPEMRVPPRVLEQEQTPEPAPPKAEPETEPEPEPQKMASESEPQDGVAKTVESVAQQQRLSPPTAVPETVAEASEPTPEPAAPSTTPENVADAPGESQAASTPPTSATTQPAAARSTFGVQIAAFETPQRADVAKQQLESKSSYQARIVTSESGRLYKVVVGSYADYATASQARDDLRSRYQYRDCFVTTLD